MTTPITSFSGKYRWLSNFWPCPVEFQGLMYPTVEHAYQAAKTLDPKQRLELQHIAKPGDAKRYGQKVTLRKDWGQVKVGVMKYLLREKFNNPAGRNSDMKALLIETGDAMLIEGNHWGDTYWGVCRGKGENVLGRLLMQIREEVVSETDHG